MMTLEEVRALHDNVDRKLLLEARDYLFAILEAAEAQEPSPEEIGVRIMTALFLSGILNVVEPAPFPILEIVRAERVYTKAELLTAWANAEEWETQRDDAVDQALKMQAERDSLKKQLAEAQEAQRYFADERDVQKVVADRANAYSGDIRKELTEEADHAHRLLREVAAERDAARAELAKMAVERNDFMNLYRKTDEERNTAIAERDAATMKLTLARTEIAELRGIVSGLTRGSFEDEEDFQQARRIMDKSHDWDNDDWTKHTHCLEDRDAALESARVANERVKKLEAWIEHRVICDKRIWSEICDCNCGLDALFAETAP